jgi:signal transduction histidine kinase
MPLQLEKLGLENALLSLLTKAKESGELESNIAISESCDELPWMIELGLYRIFSELINNTIKHADATTIEISILLEDGQLFCRYSDNGKGINLDTSVTGLGMQSVENRIDALQGSWEYGDRSSGGFFARIRIPLNK